MLREQTTIGEFKVYLTSLTTEERRLSEKLKKVQNTIVAVQQAMSGYSGWRTEHPEAETVTQPQVTADDIKHCSSQKEALVAIAKLSNGIVRSREAGRLLMNSGLTNSQDINAAGATAHRRLTEHPDFDYHEPGTFKYKPFFADEQVNVRPSDQGVTVNEQPLFESV